MYSAAILADSLGPTGIRLTTLQICFPRIVLAEFNTHRALSRNSASSRAIPIEHRIKAVRSDPFVPAAFLANKRGMSAGEALDERSQRLAREAWLVACEDACGHAAILAAHGVHKQWTNRLIEPFSWHTVIVSATDWSNFYNLRISEHAQPEIRTIAEEMKRAMDHHSPARLSAGEWHLPLVRPMDREGVYADKEETADGWLELAKLSVARCARVSYLTHDGRRDTSEDLRLHDQLLTNGHMSPFEHAAMAVTDAAPRGNFRGWLQYRKMLPKEADRLGS